jgi:hypothetical protein
MTLHTVIRTGRRTEREDNRHRRRWFRLDNAAKIYPVIMNSRHPTVFRVGLYA